jgi:hypothetical protein
MSKIDDGGPAFPVSDSGDAHAIAHAAIIDITDPDERDRVYLRAKAAVMRGMSLRDYFAGQALAHLSPHLLTKMHLHGAVPSAPDVARLAYEVADSMLAERNRGAE